MPLFPRRRRGRAAEYLLREGKEFTLESPAFRNGEAIPTRFTCDGEDVSPPLRWSTAPEGAKSYALVMYDPDAPRGTFIHWVLYDIPGGRAELPEAVPPSAQVEGIGLQGRNDFGRIGYGGPCPPRGHGPHRYFFALHALSVPTLGLPPGATANELIEEMKGKVLGYAVLMGTYAR